ncbi:hypothetical protein PSTG_07689 [Puccinia striiformis f. sp. tritici PST-78]|uniref:Uncharacterized protein n=1 Tax=Puccinia striiformis f. sp. tritici PST-78 TaxID=1165861 RepID=A0A0L0VIK7_9BASI|nr:hypothetical protein PSTG_07689 [Puccinia striiformis f. sp. tritici PST-78]
MSNTAAEAVPATQPAVETPAVTDTAAAPAAQNKRFSNVHKTRLNHHTYEDFPLLIFRALLGAFHTAGEQIRGHINAALDGAGDAIADRKGGKVTGRKSGEEASRSTDATPVATAPAVPAAQAESAVPAESAPVVAPTTAALDTNTAAETVPAAAATTSAAEAPAEKRSPIGQFINTNLKRTSTLVQRVGGTLRSKGNSTVDSLSATTTRASRRFSRAPKATEGPAEDLTAAAPPAAAPLADVPATEPATKTA